MVREVSVCKEAEAEVEALMRRMRPMRLVEVSSEALLAESRLESKYAGDDKADDHNDNQSWSGPAPDLL